MTRAPHRIVLLTSALLALAITACGRPESTSFVPAGRLIDIEPSVELHREWAGPRAPARSWSLLDPAERAEWTLLDGAAWRDGSGLVIQAPVARLRLTEPIVATAVSGLTLRLSSTKGCEIRVAWEADPSLQVNSAPEGRDASSIWVDLSAHPGWRGTVDNVRLIIRSCQNKQATDVLLESAGDDGPVELPADLPAAWKVTLAQDTRNAVVAPPGAVHRWDVTTAVPSGQVRVGLGIFGRPVEPVTFDIRLEGEREEVLGSFELEPGDWEAEPGWRDVSIPVRDLAAGSRIAITTRSDAGWPIRDAVPVLGGPHVVADSAERRLNVVLISIDTLRADHLSLYGYDRETSPHLGRRARENGIAFRNVVAPAGWTLPSHVSMFSGVNTIRHGVNFETPIPLETRMLAELFKETGYETVAFTAGGYVSSAFGLSRGFRSFRTRRAQNPSSASSQRELEDGIEQFNGWLGDRPTEPFFAFFHTYEVHAPYWARAPFFERFGGDEDDVPLGYGMTNKLAADGRVTHRFVVPTGAGSLSEADPELIERLYDSGIAFMDHQIERLFEALESEGLADRTLVALTSDHGELLMEQDFAGHGPVYDPGVMVPLVLWLPQRQQEGRMIDDQVQLVDLAPTLLDLVGIEVANRLDGASLRPLWEGTGEYPQRPALIHGGTFGVAARFANRLKYIWHRTPWDHFGAGEELYDLASDPGELDDIATAAADLLLSSRETTRAALADQLPGFRMTFDNPTAESFRIRIGGANNRRAAITPVECADLEWHRGRRFSFQVEPATRCDVTLEYLTAAPVSVEVVGGTTGKGPLPASLELATREFDRPRVYALVSGRWQLVEADSGARETLRLFSGWKAGPIAEGEVEMDAALLEQLRALGYLD